MTVPTFKPLKKNRYCKSISDLAEVMAMSRNTLNGWSQDGTLKKKKPGWFTGDVMKILQQKVTEAENAEDDEGVVTPNLEKKRKWQAKLAKLSYRHRRGELLERDLVLKQILRMEQKFKAHFRRMPKELKQRLQGKSTHQVQEILDSKFSAAFNELSDWVESFHKEGDGK